VTKLPKWLDIAELSLGPRDKVEYSWPGTYNEHSGKMVLSKKKLLFVEETGFIFKTADLLLEASYDKIDEITTENGNQLVLSMDNGVKHHIETPFLPKAKETLRDLMA
jgi:hypothetical protein